MNVVTKMILTAVAIGLILLTPEFLGVPGFAMIAAVWGLTPTTK